MIDFYALAIGDRIVYVCSYCESLVNLTETHRQYHEDADPGPDAAEYVADDDETWGPMLLQRLAGVIEGDTILPSGLSLVLARRILDAGWRPTQ